MDLEIEAIDVIEVAAATEVGAVGTVSSTSQGEVAAWLETAVDSVAAAAAAVVAVAVAAVAGSGEDRGPAKRFALHELRGLPSLRAYYGPPEPPPADLQGTGFGEWCLVSPVHRWLTWMAGDL